jgi:type VII secretion-associated serine protease mycosin
VSLSSRFGLALAAASILIVIQPANAAEADVARNKQWHLKFLHIAEAHTITKGSGITVAVVDTGVSRHPELQENLLAGINLVPGGSGNGQSDSLGHGTAMAGLIAARGRSKGDGVLGIAPEAKILPVKTNATDETTGALLSDGIKWAVEQGAQVINVSASSAPTAGLNKAIDAAAAEDILVVAASGNRPQDFRIGYPAALDGVLAVGAVDRSGRHASFSINDDAVQLCAPGVDMETTSRTGGYFKGVGTSDATAIVSGAAALVRSKFPDLTAPQVIDRLTSTATDIGPPGRDEQCGFGLLNIVKALTADLPSAGGSSPPADSAPTGAAAPAPDGESQTAAIVAWTGGAVVVLLGALISVLLVRRRKT